MDLTTQINELDIYKASDLDSDIEHRLAIVERAIRLQMALGGHSSPAGGAAPEGFGGFADGALGRAATLAQSQ